MRFYVLIPEAGDWNAEIRCEPVRRTENIFLQSLNLYYPSNKCMYPCLT
jgi:hypothetical protein